MFNSKVVIRMSKDYSVCPMAKVAETNIAYIVGCLWMSSVICEQLHVKWTIPMIHVLKNYFNTFESE